jgi:plasmid stabilization system protein ParE
MRIKLSEDFIQKLDRQINYIAQDKPKAARKFKHELLKRIKDIGKFPKKYKRSPFISDEYFRQLSYKGYTIVYKIDMNEDEILVFGLYKYEDEL